MVEVGPVEESKKETLLSVSESLTTKIAELKVRLKDLEIRAQRYTLSEDRGYSEPWRSNHVLEDVADDWCGRDVAGNNDPTVLLREIIEESKKQQIWFVQRLEAKGFDLSAPDYRGSLAQLVKFIDYGFRRDLLGNAGGIFMGESVQRDSPYLLDKKYLRTELLKLFTRGSWRRGGDIAISDHEVLHAQQFNPEGQTKVLTKMKVLYSLPMILIAELIHRSMPQLDFPKRIYPSNSPVHEAHTFLGSTEDYLRESKAKDASPLQIPKIIIENLQTAYGFDSSQSQAAIWALLRLRSLMHYIREKQSLDAVGSYPDFDRDVGVLVYRWSKMGRAFDPQTKTFPYIEDQIKAYERLAGIEGKGQTDEREQKIVIAQLVTWDLLSKRHDELLFADIAREKIAQSLNDQLKQRHIKTMWLHHVVEAVNKREGLHTFGFPSDIFPQIFFPDDAQHPYTLQWMTGYTFSRGEGRDRHIINKVDEKMKCFRVKLKNDIHETQPAIRSLRQLKQDHFKVVFPRFLSMLEKAIEREKTGDIPYWGTGYQSLAKAAIFGNRFDQLPWQYRFSAVIYGLGLQEFSTDLMTYMSGRIRAGELSEDNNDRWRRAAYDSEHKLAQIKQRWQSKSVNILSPQLAEAIEQKINELPEKLLLTINTFDLTGREGQDASFFLGPDLFRILGQAVTRAHQSKEQRALAEQEAKREAENKKELSTFGKIIEVLEEHLPKQGLTIISAINEILFEFWYIGHYFTNKPK